jgi:hypothetical protein
MPFIPVPNVAQVKLFGSIDGQETINDLYFEVSGGGITPVNLATLAGVVGGWGQSHLAPLLSDDWQLVRTVCIDLTAQNSFQVDIGTPATGGVSGEANPNNVAACIKFSTALGGRSFRGRNYVPGIPGSVVTLNTMDATFMNNLSDAYFMMVGAGTFLPGWQWVVVSRFANNLPRTAGIATPVTSTGFTSPYVRSMRTREVGKGS